MKTNQRHSIPGTLLFGFLIPVFFFPARSLAQTKAEPDGKRTAVIVSKINDPVVNEFQKAWLLSGNGYDKTEALVLLYRMRDGSISARSLGRSGQYRQFTFPWTQAIIAVVHTHPNGDDPQPLGEDLRSADKLGIPVFTITHRGMYVYDPDTKKISMVRDGLDWLDATKWVKDQQTFAREKVIP
jgi:hypothetical protein